MMMMMIMDHDGDGQEGQMAGSWDSSVMVRFCFFNSIVHVFWIYVE